MEKLQHDASQPLDLEQHARDMQGAIDDARKGGQGPAHSKSDSNMELAAAVGFEIAVSAFYPQYQAIVMPLAAVMTHTIYEELSSDRKKSVPGKSKKDVSRSKYVSIDDTGKALNERKPVVPLSYTEKKKQAPRKRLGTSIDIGEKVQIAGKVTAGDSDSDGKKTETQGIKMNVPVAKIFIYYELLKELGITNKLKKDPYADGVNRLKKDLEKGNDAAESYVLRNPAILKSVAPG